MQERVPFAEPRVIAQLSQLRERKPTRIDVDGEKIILVRFGDEVCAITDECPHAGASMAHGYIRDRTIECPIHLAVFNLDSGAAVRAPQIVATTYEVTVAGDDILLIATRPGSLPW